MTDQNGKISISDQIKKKLFSMEKVQYPDYS